MFWQRREDPLVGRLKEEVAYLREQLERGREREDTLRRELVTIASSRAAAEIAFYEKSRQPVPTPSGQPWPPPERIRSGPTAFDNHLGGGEHLDDEPELGAGPHDTVDEDELADRTIERQAREREEERLRKSAEVS